MEYVLYINGEQKIISDIQTILEYIETLQSDSDTEITEYRIKGVF